MKKMYETAMKNKEKEEKSKEKSKEKEKEKELEIEKGNGKGKDNDENPFEVALSTYGSHVNTGGQGHVQSTNPFATLGKIDEAKEQNINVPITTTTTAEKKEKKADKLETLLTSHMSSRLTAQTSSSVHAWGSVRKMKICDPLVVILGIGEYHDISQNLIGIGTDYKRCVHAFNNRYNYSVFYQNRKSENVYSTTKMNLETAKLSRSVKIEWTYEEIIEFFENARNVVVNNKHDSLIIIISYHGESDGVIIDSNHEEMSLMEIYYLFTRDECDYLKDKPKIVFVDACLGKMLSNVKSKA